MKCCCCATGTLTLRFEGSKRASVNELVWFQIEYISWDDLAEDGLLSFLNIASFCLQSDQHLILPWKLKRRSCDNSKESVQSAPHCSSQFLPRKSSEPVIGIHTVNTSAGLKDNRNMDPLLCIQDFAARIRVETCKVYRVVRHLDEGSGEAAHLETPLRVIRWQAARLHASAW